MSLAKVLQLFPDIDYTLRFPEKTILYKSIIANMNTVFQEMEEQGRYLPFYVNKEFDAFLDCGIFARGFIKLSYNLCSKVKIVAFSCKKRGLCPSCGGRRMSDTAAHIIDNVIPGIPTRQWVLSFPFNLRYIFAYNKKAVQMALTVVLRTISRFYINKAVEMSIKNPKTGCVTVIQRFGGSLNLNVHFHTLFIDGVYDQSGTFHEIPPPTNDDILKIVEKIRIRVFRSMQKQYWIDQFQIADPDQLGLEFPGLAQSYSSSIQRKNNDGHKIHQIGKRFNKYSNFTINKSSMTAFKDGFSLNARVRIHGNDRQGLEHLCRYIARPAVVNSRLATDKDDNIIYELKNPYSDGTTHLKFTPRQFIEKLIALVPTPRMNLTRYHGVLAPNSKIRKIVVSKTKSAIEAVLNKRPIINNSSKYRINSAELIKRVFKVEIDKCRCGGKLKLVAAIFNIDATTKIMKSLQIEVYIPTLERARGPPQTFFDF